ncbi:flavonoid 3',5'-hydroxylase 1-like [Musa acuminata AAA Group]|uniref:flavonoid 3',5'-hydroxylase 1-like n=1 Tax=Musa acuminata AAA Group TaxID=214697 RepID=UPI0031CF0A43
MDMATTFLRELFLCVALYYILRHVVSRLLSCFSPLPPGPRGFPVVGALPLLGSAPHVTLAGMAKRYGPVMHLKMGQFGMVVASTPDAARVFLKTLDPYFSNRPVDAASVRLAYGGQDLVFAEYGPKWKLLRRLCKLEMLGNKALESWAAVRRDEVGRMLRSMHASGRKGEPVMLGGMLIYTIANMIGRVILSRRVFETKGSEANEFKDMVVELMTLAAQVNISDFLPAVAWMDLQGLEARMKKLHKKFDRVLSRMVAEHEASKGEREGRPDLLDAVMAIRDGPEEEKLTNDNVKALLLNLFTAGTDTSKGTIEWAMAEMQLNPSILRRAQAEMDGVIGRNRRLEESDIPNLPYLQAICKESFRKHPSTPLNLPRISTQACEVNGYYIPKNTKLFVNVWAIGRDPDVWEHPLEFDPDRFMTAKGAKIDPRGNDFELIPFGAGRRICAGVRAGVVLVQYMLGSLIHSFDWSLPEGSKPDMGETFGIALQKTVPVAAMVSPRCAPSVYD